MKSVSILIPQPVSANRIWRTTRQGRTYLNPRYRQWRKDALSSLWEQKPEGGFPSFPASFNVHIIAPLKTRVDLDNMVKPAIDFLADPARIIANDKHTQSATISRSADIPKGMLRVIVFEAKEAA